MTSGQFGNYGLNKFLISINMALKYSLWDETNKFDYVTRGE